MLRHCARRCYVAPSQVVCDVAEVTWRFCVRTWRSASSVEGEVCAVGCDPLTGLRRR